MLKIEENKEELKKFFPLTSPNVAISHGILEGKIKGDVWINNENNACLIVSNSSFNFVSGDIDDKFIFNSINLIPEKKFYYLVNCSSSYKFNKEFPLISRLHYSGAPENIREVDSNKIKIIQDRYTLSEVTSELFEKCAWRNKLLEFYDTKEAFLKGGFGALLLKNNEVIVEIYGTIGCNHFEVGAYIKKEYRGIKGSRLELGDYVISTALKKYCMEKNLLVTASCAQSNRASENGILRFGLTKDYEYQVLDIFTLRRGLIQYSI
ncbi:MAG: GNAT family N-acetyltransferase [Gammaproteobacteria bacterium]